MGVCREACACALPTHPHTMFTNPPRIPLAHLPTPLEGMPHLSEALGGPRRWIKRDDQTGLATGGNKTRKLEFLMAEALAQEADTVITTDAPQSNHCRQTETAAARHGVGCVRVLTGNDPGDVTGNILLDHLFGARLVFTGNRGRDEVIAEIAQAERSAQRTPYVIPGGGSVPLGAAAYALAMVELQAQMKSGGLRFDRIIYASGSGGTQAGLVAGAALTGFRDEILGISISQDPAKLQSNIAELATGIGSLIGLIRQGLIRPDENVLFWHTGGTAGLFAFAEPLME